MYVRSAFDITKQDLFVCCVTGHCLQDTVSQVEYRTAV
jgi:hypothetical protein